MKALTLWSGLTVAIAIGAQHAVEDDKSSVSTVKTTASRTLSNFVPFEPLGQKIVGDDSTDVAGQAISLSDDGLTIAVGVDNHDGDAPNEQNVGHVRVYTWSEDQNQWLNKGDEMEGDVAHDRFGRSLCISGNGNIVAVGVPYHDAVSTGGTLYSVGRARIYEWVNDQWQQKGNDIDGTNSQDKHGFSISLSVDGSVVGVGAPDTDNNGANSGYARVFKYHQPSNTWQQRGGDIDGESSNDKSGYAISLDDSGDYIAVGAIHNTVDNTLQSGGHVRVHKYNDNLSEWEQLGTDIDGELHKGRFGFSVALNAAGDVLVVGAPGTPNGQDQGIVNVYEYEGTDWVRRGDTFEDASEVRDEFGRYVSISKAGDKVAVGAPKKNTVNQDTGETAWLSGQVNVWEWMPFGSLNKAYAHWQKLGLGQSGTSHFSQAGFSAEIAPNGLTLAIGAPSMVIQFDGFTAPIAEVQVFRIAEAATEDSPPPGTYGDPHFTTVNGELFSYHGQCDLVLLRSEGYEFESDYLEVHIRTTRVENIRHMKYSYISGAAVKIGKDFFEVQDDSTLLINGAEQTEVSNFAGFPMTKTVKGKKKSIVVYHLYLGSEKSIEIRANVNSGMISVQTSGHFPERQGLLGSLEGSLAPDGKTDMSGHWNSLGEAWQVKGSDPKLFADKDRVPQYPDGCVYEDIGGNTKTSLRRRLMAQPESVEFVDEVSAAKACANARAEMKEFCTIDVLAANDLELANDPVYN